MYLFKICLPCLSPKNRAHRLTGPPPCKLAWRHAKEHGGAAKAETSRSHRPIDPKGDPQGTARRKQAGHQALHTGPEAQKKSAEVWWGCVCLYTQGKELGSTPTPLNHAWTPSPTWRRDRYFKK